MIDTRNKRAAALGFGLAFLLVLPAAEGALSIESAGHALSAYRFDLEDQFIEPADGDVVQIPFEARTVLIPDDLRTFLMPERQRP